MKCTTVCGVFAALVTIAGCGNTDPSGGLDFTRQLEPGEYQVLVTGDVKRSFEGTGATYQELGTPPFVGWNRVTLNIFDDVDALDGAAFDLCAVPTQPTVFSFDAATVFPGCPYDNPSMVTGGFVMQLGAAQADELDCYANDYGQKDFDGTLTLVTVTDHELQGEAQGSGVCSRHPHSEVEPMKAATVSVRVRFRAMKTAAP